MPYSQRLTFEIREIVDEDFRPEAERRTKRAGIALVGFLQRNLGIDGGKRTGRRYKVPGTKNKRVWYKRVHRRTRKKFKQRYWVARTKYTASAEGQFPAVRLGHLRSSILMTPDRDARPDASVLVGPRRLKRNYGRILELKDPSKGGRPYLRRTATENYREIVKILRGEA